VEIINADVRITLAEDQNLGINRKICSLDHALQISPERKVELLKQ
jgi:hypothetical protein